MRDRHLQHITLTTAHTRRSYRDEVDDDVVVTCRQLLEDALTHPQQHTEVPGTNGCAMTATADGRALIVTVWGPHTEIRNAAPQRPPLVTFGVATHSKHGARLWRLLHHARQAELSTDVEQCPQEPWIAARIELGAALMPEAMTWIGDFERCVGWAWVESDDDRKTQAR